jgi:hypothetical protein
VGGRRLSGYPRVGLRAWRATTLFTGVSLIAAINSIVGGIGLAAADCQGRELGGQRCPPRYHRRPGSFGLHLLHQHQRAADLRPQMRSLAATLKGLARPARRSDLLEQVLAGCRWTLV